MFQILVVEDSQEYQKIIDKTLSGYQMIYVSSAEAGLNSLGNSKFDLIIVDINLPNRDGYSFITDVHQNSENKNAPIFCLSGRNEITDKVTAFSLGADDYITKPFDPIELRARVDSKIKKGQQKKNEGELIQVGDIHIDHVRHRVMIGDRIAQTEIKLTQTEFKLLCCLLKRPEQVFSRDQLLVSVWGSDARVLDRVVDAHICLLRKKLSSQTHQIKSITGLGYKISKTRNPMNLIL